MAAVSLSNSVNRTADFDTGTGYSITSIGGGAAAAQELVTFYEGTASISRKVASSSGAGWWINLTTPVNMTTGDDKVWMCKLYLSDNADLNSTGMRLRMGDSTTTYYEYLVHDDGTNVDPWPGTRSWLIIPIDVNQAEWRYATSGSPTLTAVDEFAVVAALANGGAKSENLFLDEIDLSDGLYLVGGDGGDTDGVFQDFVDYDEGTQGNKWGHVITQGGILFVAGKLIIGRTSGGTSTATVFQDTGTVMVFPESRTAAGWNELEADLGNATTDIDWNDCVFNGRGTGAARAFFNTTTDVDGTNEDITLSGYTGVLRTGDAVVYSQEGGSQNIGLTNGTTYWIYETATAGDWTIHSTYADSLTGASPINLTAGGSETHSFQKTPDTRPDLTVTGTTGVFDATGCTFDNFRNIVLTSAATLTNCKILGAEQVTQSSATITGCTFSNATTEDGEALIVSDDPGLISNCDFTFSDGHAIEITTPGTYTFTGNTFNGYGTTSSNDAAIYNNSGGSVTLNVTGASSPTYRNGASATTTINNNVSVTFTGLKDNTEVRVYQTSNGAPVAGTENATTGTTDNRSYTWSAASGLGVYYKIFNNGYEEIHVKGFTVPGTSTSIPIQQRLDRNYSNP